MSQRQIKPFTVEVRRSRLRPAILGFVQTGDKELFADGLRAREPHADKAYDEAMRAARRAFEDQITEPSPHPSSASLDETETKTPRILRNESKEQAYTPEGLVRKLKEERLEARALKRQRAIEARTAKTTTPSDSPESVPAPNDIVAEMVRKLSSVPHPARESKARTQRATVAPASPKAQPIIIESAAARRSTSRVRQSAPPVLLAGERWKRRLRWVK